MKPISIIVLISIMFISSLYSQNLLKNPGMEESNSKALRWRLDEFVKDATIVKIEYGDAHGGNNYVSLENTVANDARLTQTVKIEENTNYRISGWIKTENVSYEGVGANLSLDQHWFISREIKGTSDEWQYVEFYLCVTEGLETVTVCMRLGGYGGTSTGKASFDDVSMVKMEVVPEGNRTFTIGTTKENESRDRKTTTSVVDEENVAQTGNEYIPPVNRRELMSNIIVYSLVFLSVIIFCIQLVIIKPKKPESTEESNS